MRRTASFLLLFALLSISTYAQQPQNQSKIKEFDPIESRNVNSLFTLTVKSEVKLDFYLLSEETLATMEDHEKDIVSVYQYTYTFKNEGPNKVRFTFLNAYVLASPLFKSIQDLSIVLDPGQEREVKFIANGPPNVMSVYYIPMVWHEGKNRWLNWIRERSLEMYIPQRYIFDTEVLF